MSDSFPVIVAMVFLGTRAVMDADGMPAPDALRWMVPHLARFRHVAAVTGDPRVANTRTLLCRLQAVEFIFAPRDGANPVVGSWGMVIAFVGISQALIGVLLDRRYDPRIWRSVLWLPLYPLIYRLLLSAAAVRGTLPGALRRPSGPVTWHTPADAPGERGQTEPEAQYLVL